ncbi:MAG: hypothetical protein ACLPY3_05285 [Solirubrobacteraceae bacterium]
MSRNVPERDVVATTTPAALEAIQGLGAARGRLGAQKLSHLGAAVTVCAAALTAVLLLGG